MRRNFRSRFLICLALLAGGVHGLFSGVADLLPTTWFRLMIMGNDVQKLPRAGDCRRTETTL